MNRSTALAEIGKAEAALERASDIHEMLDLRDKAMAASILADAKGFGEAAQKAKAFQLRAERKAGEWLAKHVSRGNPDKVSGFEHLPDGIDYKESSRWQLEATVPEETFNGWVDDCVATGKEITAAGLRRLAREQEREERIAEDQKEAKSIADRSELWQVAKMSLADFRENKGEAAAIITDPPYADDSLDLYEELGSLAEFCLRPGGSLLAMVGQAHLPTVSAILGTYLTYHWTIAYLMGGGQSMMYQLKVNVAWKPVLWFVKGAYAGPAVTDVVRAEAAEKERFVWQQGTAGFAHLVSAFSRPGDLIVDPMMGTATTGVAAVALGRRFVGIDIDEKRVASAKIRLSQAGRAT